MLWAASAKASTFTRTSSTWFDLQKGREGKCLDCLILPITELFLLARRWGNVKAMWKEHRKQVYGKNTLVTRMVWRILANCDRNCNYDSVEKTPTVGGLKHFQKHESIGSNWINIISKDLECKTQIKSPTLHKALLLSKAKGVTNHQGGLNKLFSSSPQIRIHLHFYWL